MGKNIDVAKEILLNELEEDSHFVRVSDVLFWALELYAKEKKGLEGAFIAKYIVNRIKTREAELNN